MFTAGTGSMLLTAAAFGAMTFGSDIDGRQLRGKSALIAPRSRCKSARSLMFSHTETSIKHSAAQYGVSNRIVDTFAFDMTVRPSRLLGTRRLG